MKIPKRIIHNGKILSNFNINSVNMLRTFILLKR